MARIRAHGGEVIRDEWRMSIVRGRLSDEAMAWIRAHRDELLREVWPMADEWHERAAIREFCGEQSREEAEAAAYREVAEC
jgi:hypothetical protein